MHPSCRAASGCSAGPCRFGRSGLVFPSAASLQPEFPKANHGGSAVRWAACRKHPVPFPRWVYLTPNPPPGCASSRFGQRCPLLPQRCGGIDPAASTGLGGCCDSGRGQGDAGGLGCPATLQTTSSLGCCHCWVAPTGPQGRTGLSLSRNR